MCLCVYIKVKIYTHWVIKLIYFKCQSTWNFPSIQHEMNNTHIQKKKKEENLTFKTHFHHSGRATHYNWRGCIYVRCDIQNIYPWRYDLPR